MLTDFDYRAKVVSQTVNPWFLQFWNHEMPHQSPHAIEPVLNKLSMFLMTPMVRNIVCQRHSAIDFDNVLNHRKILLANLSTGLLTEKNAGILGSFLVTKIVNAAFRRASIPEADRRPWYLYVDEFQAFMDLSVGFDRILAEARKYKLVLAGLANQYVGQLSPEVRAAIFGNVGVMVTFRLGVGDSASISREMGIFTPEEIMGLELGEAIVRAGGSQKTYNITTFPNPPMSENDPTDRIIANARSRYARHRKDVEEDFARWQRGGDLEPKPSSKKSSNSRGKPPKPHRPEAFDPSEDDLVH